MNRSIESALDRDGKDGCDDDGRNDGGDGGSAGNADDNDVAYQRTHTHPYITSAAARLYKKEGSS